MNQDQLPVDLPTEKMPYFRGKICHTNDTRGIGFISRPSIHQIGGPAVVLPRQDLMLHINENRELGEPLPNQKWINFFVRPGQYRKSKSGLEVFGGQLECSKIPA